jgi:hypothetical protein
MNKKIICFFLCTLLLTVVSSTAIDINNTREIHDHILVLVKIDVSQNKVDLPKDMEIVGITPNEWIDIIIKKDRLDELSDLNFEVLIWDVIAYDNSVRGQYHTLAQIEDIIEDIANDHPDITELTTIGTTYEGRDILCLEISDNPGVDEGEPGVLFMGLHHAREWPTVEICLNICEELTSGYSSIVNSNRIWVVPCVNPDGYYYCHDQGNDWRKNRKPYPGGIGVDLNRNYGGSSNGDPWGAWGSVDSGSITHFPSDSLYCGPEPFSEAETQAIRDIFLNNDIHAAISFHTHGEIVIWPWGYTQSDSTPDDTYITQLGEDIAQEITKQSGSGTYTPKQASFLYPTTGDTTDWAYGYSHYVLGRPTFIYTIEMCNDFHPPANYLDQIVSENFDGALVLLQEAENIRDTVVPRVVPPIIDEMGTDSDGDYTVSWVEKNPDANPSKFQLDELIGPNIDLDDAESGSGYWDLDGFSLSTARFHSSSHSYKSGSADREVFTMVTADPIPVTEGMNLEFWTWYDIEFNWDYAMAEVSIDGRSYDLLEGFTGSSSGWEERQYPLTDYEGESIFIRLRYITDQNTLEEGIYFDDITPVVEWDTISTLSDTITSDSFEITGKENGKYYYRVNGYNSEHEWGDFSTLEDIKVEEIMNDPPATPTIDGPASGKPGNSYSYTFKTADPDGDQVYYYIEWGDGEIVDWDGPHDSNVEITLSHTWSEKGTYILKAKAKDVYEEESGWETLTVSIPRSKTVIENLFPRFQHFFNILQNFVKIFIDRI